MSDPAGWVVLDCTGEWLEAEHIITVHEHRDDGLRELDELLMQDGEGWRVFELHEVTRP
jgi:hypothetical protein